MDPEFEKKYHAFEDQYWWFRARRSLILRLLQKNLRLPTTAQILEIGCSAGPLLQLLQQHGYNNLTGFDLSPVAIELAKSRGLTNVHVMDAIQPQLPHNHFDLLIASDVLEHLEHPDIALENWLSLLKPGGRLLVFVPAFMFLWSAHDTANHHFKRYTAANLESSLRAAGFQVERTSYWNTLLFPPVAAVRLAKRVLAKQNAPATDQLNPLPSFLNTTLQNLVELENRVISANLRLPVGVSVMACARKPPLETRT